MAKTTLSKEEICARIKLGENFVKRFARNDRQFSQKFRDSSNLPDWIGPDDSSTDNEGGDVPLSAGVGQSNLIATNIITKVASIAVNNPDWHVKVNPGTDQAPTPENCAEIVRQFMRAKWRLYNWVRMSQKVAYKWFIAGLGIMAYRWDEETRSTFEHVQSWDLCIDPNVRDWRNVNWAARRIKMSLRKAIERYPDYDKWPQVADDNATLDSDKIEIWLYYDEDNECAVYKDDILESDDNKYKVVPFLFQEGTPDPGTSMWPLGEFALGEGLQVELSDINLSISNSAKHGGPMNLVVEKRLGKAGMQALENGMSQGYISVEDLVSPPISRIAAEELSPMIMEAKRESQNALDALQGVNQYQRGVINQDPKFATEAALASRQSGAMGQKAQTEFELFLNRMAEVVVMLEKEFGGPDENTPGEGTDEQHILWECMKFVDEITVIESSSTYKDPTAEVQQDMQLLNVFAQLNPLLAQMGTETINLSMFAKDIIRNSGRTDPERYMLPPQPQPSGPPPPEVKIALSGQLMPNEVAQAFATAFGGQQGPGAADSGPAASGMPAAQGAGPVGLPPGGDGTLPPGNIPKNGLAPATR